MPIEVARTQPVGRQVANPRGNHVRGLDAARRAQIEATGATVLQSEDGILAIELKDEQGKRVHIVARDVRTQNGTQVIGIAFLDEAEIEAFHGQPTTGFTFGPQRAYAHQNGTNHYHYPGFPFTCSYVYNWASGDSTFHICPNDVNLLQYVSTAWGAALGALFHPVVGLVAGVLIYSSWHYFKNPDGSIDMFGPNASIDAAYGNTYYWGTRRGWYYHYSKRHPYYGYALRHATGALYRTK